MTHKSFCLPSPPMKVLDKFQLGGGGETFFTLKLQFLKLVVIKNQKVFTFKLNFSCVHFTT